MDFTTTTDTIRRAIGGDVSAAQRIREAADDTASPLVLVVAALLDRNADRLDTAKGVAQTSRDRQVVEIARASLAGLTEQVDALAREHLVDHPDNLVVAWIASGALVPPPPPGNAH